MITRYLQEQKEPWIVVLYAPLCLFCEAMEESYVDLAENLAGSGVKVGKFRAEYAKREPNRALHLRFEKGMAGLSL